MNLLFFDMLDSFKVSSIKGSKRLQLLENINLYRGKKYHEFSSKSLKISEMSKELLSKNENRFSHNSQAVSQERKPKDTLLSSMNCYDEFMSG